MVVVMARNVGLPWRPVQGHFICKLCKKLIMTSGDDGIFPRGIAVGQAGIAPDQLWHVRLASNASPIDFVRLIPPSNFPPPLEPLTPPPLTAVSVGEVPVASVTGGVLPLAPGAAPVPIAATPEAIRAAQTEVARRAAQQSQVNQALTKKLIAERDAAREVARKAEAARLLAVRTANTAPRSETGPTVTSEMPRPLKVDPPKVPVAPSALSSRPSEPNKNPSSAPATEGPNK